VHELIRELDMGENDNISLKMIAVCEEDKGPGNHQHGLDGGITTHVLDPHDDASLSFHRGRDYWHHALVLLCRRSRMRTEVMGGNTIGDYGRRSGMKNAAAKFGETADGTSK
jgi:hypothetical protein